MFYGYNLKLNEMLDIEKLANLALWKYISKLIEFLFVDFQFNNLVLNSQI